MARLLLTVNETRLMEGGDLVLLPGIESEAGEEFCAGDPIRLKRPDGSLIEWEIGALTVFSRSLWRKDISLIVKGLGRDDVPVGTEVWSARSHLIERGTQQTRRLPNRVVVRVNHPSAEGLAVHLFFGMMKRNSFGYVVFLGPDGTAEVSGEELLRYFHQEWSLALMDFVDPEISFTGHIAARVWSTEEVQRAIKGYEMFRKYCSFPEGYEKNLKKAAARAQNPEDYHVEVIAE